MVLKNFKDSRYNFFCGVKFNVHVFFFRNKNTFVMYSFFFSQDYILGHHWCRTIAWPTRKSLHARIFRTFVKPQFWFLLEKKSSLIIITITTNFMEHLTAAQIWKVPGPLSAYVADAKTQQNTDLTFQPCFVNDVTMATFCLPKLWISRYVVHTAGRHFRENATFYSKNPNEYLRYRVPGNVITAVRSFHMTRSLLSSPNTSLPSKTSNPANPKNSKPFWEKCQIHCTKIITGF